MTGRHERTRVPAYLKTAAGVARERWMIRYALESERQGYDPRNHTGSRCARKR